jgi:two-component system sensor kinase FixL
MLPLLGMAASLQLTDQPAPAHRRMTRQLMTDVQQLATGLDHSLAELGDTLNLAAIGIAKGDAALTARLLAGVAADLRAHDPDAQLQLRPPRLEPPAELSVEEAVSGRHLTISRLIQDTVSPARRVHVIQPVIRDNAVVAVLDAAVTPAFFQAALNRLAPSGTVALLDDDFEAIATLGHGPPVTPGPARLMDLGDPTGALQARANLALAAGWQVVLSRPAPAPPPPDPQRLAALGLLALGAMFTGLAIAAALGGRMTRKLNALTGLAGSLAQAGERRQEPPAASHILEFEALRLGLIQAGAVLRRRLSAERVALREARTGHDLLDSVLNATAECISVKDLDLRYVLINRAALMVWPQPLDEWQVLGRCAVDLYPPDVAHRIELADRAVLASGQMSSFELDIDWAGPPQAARWLWVTVTPWQDAEGRVVGVVSVSRDITEQRAAGIRLRGMQADLLRATRLSAMGAMAGGLAHELNQPLAAATNYLNAATRLLDRPAPSPGDRTAARGAVADAAQQMLRAGAIVRRLRDFVSRGEAELEPEDVAELLRSVVDLARADGIARGMTLKLEPAAQPAVVLVDRTQIQQVLLNLIRNAAEAIAPTATGQSGAGVIRIASLVRPGDAICIDVIDNGPGLDREVIERLFQPFVSTKPAGMGIGLTICHTIAEGHGGDLVAESMPEGGMRFRLSLPAVPQQEASARRARGYVT